MGKNRLARKQPGSHGSHEPHEPHEPFDQATERGSAMLLIPAAIIIVALFAAVTLDAAEAFVVQRELTAAADAMANDAIAGVNPDLVFTGDGAQLDPQLLRRLAAEALQHRSADIAKTDVATITEVDGGVEVALSATVRPFFGRLLHPSGWKVRATARAFPVTNAE